jgi:hypothetical protein
MALASYSISNPWLQIWHERTAHLGEQNLLKLKEAAHGMKEVPEACLCEPCVQGRMKEVPHKVPAQRGTYPLEFIHTDIGGHFPATGCCGERYWVTFLDDYTQMAEVYPISQKSEFFPCLKNFLERYERPERRCHRIRLDWAGENRLTEFHDFCTDRGIAVEVTAVEQHQQNGSAEVLNRILMN